MKRLIICCDGTWSEWDKEFQTNVAKVARAILPAGPHPTAPGGCIPQVVFYDEGVGTANILDRVRGGVFGHGLDDNVADAYRFLVNNYEGADEIFLFGFSRGAYTARSTAGLIRKCGLLRKREGHRIREALALYRRRDPDPDLCDVQRFRNQYSHPNPSTKEEKYSHVIDIEFLGVWDTVGSLGIPLRSLSRGPWNDKYKFHNHNLSRIVRNAYHAVAIDERRGAFPATVWTSAPAKDQKVEQVWFAGVHGQVGGGGFETGLSDLALGWMIDKASQCGLVLDDVQVPDIKAGANPNAGVAKSPSGIYKWLLPETRWLGDTKPVPRGLWLVLLKTIRWLRHAQPPAPVDVSTQSLHPSVCVKYNTDSPPYRRKNLGRYLKSSHRKLAQINPGHHWDHSPANQLPPM